MNPPFLRLPEELLAHIITFLTHRPHLHSLALTCRTLNRLATPPLYTHITLCAASFRFLRPLAFLLFTSRKHARLVRSITVRRAYGGDLVPWPKQPDVERVLKRVIEKWVREEERERWFREVWDGEGVLAVAGLVVRCCEGVGRMGWDGWELVDPGWKGRRDE